MIEKPKHLDHHASARWPSKMERKVGTSHSSLGGQTMELKVIKTLAALAGFALSLLMFLGGAGLSAWLLAAKPVSVTAPARDQTSTWNEGVRLVDTSAQNFERLPSRAVPDTYSAKKLITDATLPIDATTTGSISTASQSEDNSALSAANLRLHTDWCANNYRSYRASDNSYRSYSGARRICASPYSSLLDISSSPRGGTDSIGQDEASLDYVSDVTDTSYADSAHARYCSSRYRSYRPDDNTYQPFSGGPRRQCR